MADKSWEAAEQHTDLLLRLNAHLFWLDSIIVDYLLRKMSRTLWFFSPDLLYAEGSNPFIYVNKLSESNLVRPQCSPDNSIKFHDNCYRSYSRRMIVSLLKLNKKKEIQKNWSQLCINRFSFFSSNFLFFLCLCWSFSLRNKRQLNKLKILSSVRQYIFTAEHPNHRCAFYVERVTKLWSSFLVLFILFFRMLNVPSLCLQK